jgi:hypothetical protein
VFAAQRHVIPVATVAVLAVTGCGTERRKAAVTNAQFIASADAICQAEQAKFAYIGQRAPALRQRARTVDHTPIIPSLIRQQVAQSRLANGKLEALPQPPGDRARIGKWLTARTVAATIASDLGEAPAGEHATAVRDVLNELKRANALAQRLAGDYGLEACRAAE